MLELLILLGFLAFGVYACWYEGGGWKDED